jgi:hypothetical protein
VLKSLQNTQWLKMEKYLGGLGVEDWWNNREEIVNI